MEFATRRALFFEERDIKEVINWPLLDKRRLHKVRKKVGWKTEN